MGVTGSPPDKTDRFRESLGLPFPLVGDPEGAILRAYEVRWPIIGLARRTTYVIERDRKILKAYRNERSMTAHAAETCEFVSGLSR